MLFEFLGIGCAIAFLFLALGLWSYITRGETNHVFVMAGALIILILGIYMGSEGLEIYSGTNTTELYNYLNYTEVLPGTSGNNYTTVAKLNDTAIYESVTYHTLMNTSGTEMMSAVMMLSGVVMLLFAGWRLLAEWNKSPSR